MSGAQFRTLRKHLGLRQDEMARRLGVTRKTIVQLEASAQVRMVYALAVARLCDVLEPAA